MLNKILVGTDGSETAAYAVERAAQLAADTGAELLTRFSPQERRLSSPKHPTPSS